MKERTRQIALFLSPAGILLGGVTLFPLGYLFWLGFTRNSPYQSGFVGLDNYLRLAGDGRFWSALWNTAYFSAVSVSAELLLGLGIALLLDRAFHGRGLVRAAVMAPWAIPTVVTAKMWDWMYNPDFGVFNYLLGAPVNWLGSPATALHAAIAMDVWKTTPFVALLLGAGLADIPRELYRAAALDGASAWQMLIRVTLPLLRPLIIVVLLLRTIDAFRVFDAIYVLTGGGPGNSTETLSVYAYKVFFQSLEFGYGAAVSVTVFGLIGATALVYARLLMRERR